MQFQKLDIQGHRGCAGLMPENTIPAFLKALELGVNTLEMDVVISGDNQVIVSHEHYFRHDLALDPIGRPISEEDELNHNIYQMSVEDIQKYDCGSLPHPRFENQLKIKAYKPKLTEVIDHVESWISKHQIEKIKYNIEIKRNPENDGFLHPAPEEYVTLVLHVLRDQGVMDRVILQSFDVETLQIINQLAPEIPVAFLVSRGTIQENLSKLGFDAQIYSPNFRLLSKNEVDELHRRKMKVIPWTVNNPEDINKMLEAGVDGIISDFPDRILEEIRTREKNKS